MEDNSLAERRKRPCLPGSQVLPLQNQLLATGHQHNLLKRMYINTEILQ